MNTLNKYEFAYLAGFVDGDGYITFGLSEGYPFQNVVIAQKDRDFLEYWKRRLDIGSIVTQKNNWGEVSTLKFTNVPARYLCEGMAPYLRLKRQKALDAIMLDIPQDKSREMFWPYLAGLVDAEGTIGIYKAQAGKKKQLYDTPKLQIPQKDRALLEGLIADLGFGNISRRGKNLAGNQMWYLSLGSKQVRAVVGEIRPYLMIKASVADEVLAHQKKVYVNSATDRPEAKRAAELYQAGSTIADIAKELNAKPATVNYWLRRQGVTRSLSESQQLRRQREAQSPAL